MTARGEIAQSPSETNVLETPTPEGERSRRGNERSNRQATIETPCGYYSHPPSTVQRNSNFVLHRYTLPRQTCRVYDYIKYPTELIRRSTVHRVPTSPNFILQAGYTTRKSGLLSTLYPDMVQVTQSTVAAPHLLYPPVAASFLYLPTKEVSS